MRRGFVGIIALGALLLLIWLPASQSLLRDVLIVPVLRAFWIGQLIFDSLPQSAVWFFLVFIAVIAAWNGRIVRFENPREFERRQKPLEHTLEKYARLIYQADNDAYARWRLANRLAALAQRSFFFDTPSQLRDWLASEPAEVPAELRRYLLAGLSPFEPVQRGFQLFARMDTRSGATLALDPELVVRFLEERAEQARERSRQP